MRNILKSYLKRLTNLTARNRSLVLLRLPQQQFFDVHSLDFLLNKPSFQVVEQLLERQNMIPVCDFLDPRDERSNEISKQLTQLSRTEKLIIEERGAEDLFVGYPFVKGKFSDGTAVRCPLLFFPVSLLTKTIQKKTQWCFQKRDADVVFNRSFLLAYAHFNLAGISDEWLEYSFEDFPKNSLEFRTALYKLLKESPFEINFNQDIFTDQLIDFELIKKAELEGSDRNGELKLYPQAVLGIFPQAGSYIAADYEKLLQEATVLPEDFAGFFMNNAPENKEVIREENILLPLAVDASQETIIKQIKLGQSLVVQGPPGTGKSQLIGNLVADFVARGKKVLVVCQKRAALDTVYERLTSVGMQPFMGLVHDFKNDRKALFQKIAAQIENVEPNERLNSGLDAIFLERNFDQASREIDRTVLQLDELKTALFDEKTAGKSVKEMYLKLAALAPTISIPPIADLFQFFRMDETDGFFGKIEQLERYQQLLNDGTPAANFWRERRSAAQWRLNDLVKLSNATNELQQIFRQFEERSVQLLGKAAAFRTLPANFDAQLVKLASLISDGATLAFFHRFQNDHHWKAHDTTEDRLEKRKSELTFITGATFNARLFRHPNLAKIMEVATSARFETGTFFKRWKWRLFSKHRKEWKQISREFNLKFTAAAIQQILVDGERMRLFAAIIDEMKTYEIDLAEEPRAALNTIKQVQDSLNAVTLVPKILRDTYFTQLTDLAAFKSLVIELQALTNSSTESYLATSYYFTESQVNFLDKHDGTQEINNYLREKFDFLIEIDQLTQGLTDHEKQVIDIVNASTDGTHLSLKNHVHSTLLQHWVAYVEELHPILRSVSTLRVSDLEATLQENILKKQELSKAILLIKLRETTYKSLERNRLNNVTTYRELNHQVTKKRLIWPIRKVLENYADELFDLVPCWLASPETVSAIFPLDKEVFDIVIFDEASQCYIEHGLPAAMRGKQVIIAGDSQQLQPSDLYQVRYEEETEGQPLLEIDSLLGVAGHYLPQTQLRGHYRSKSLELIAFSNRHFYKNSLQLLPDFQQINDHRPGIHYQKVNGVWERNQNRAEAEKVVEIIQQTDKNNTIGVVTFNFKQAELIDSLLRIEPGGFENVRVKNIENIQGDEFDIVIFSVGYAPNANGKLLMNFGTLNQSGGENRLNVAVTRAREEIFIVASILPGELTVEDSRNDGPKLLQAYLQFALDVSDGNFEPAPYVSKRFESAVSLKDHLLGKDEDLTGSLPFADLARKKDGNYEHLILTDDDLYFDSPGSKDAHAYLPLLLKSKHWKFERRWSREVIKN